VMVCTERVRLWVARDRVTHDVGRRSFNTVNRSGRSEARTNVGMVDRTGSP
jgi:hypothetical protein